MKDSMHHRPVSKPKMGQHFLVHTGARQSIVDALGDLAASVVLEIGPGQGAITDLLAQRAQRLIAVELDRGLAETLERKYTDSALVQVMQADILRVDLHALCAQYGVEHLRIAGNLPYYITSDILLWLFAQGERCNRAVLMMQEEVADRITATPGHSEYGLLSATTQMHARVEKLFSLPPEAFAPPPKVNSAVVRLHPAPRFTELAVERAPFERFLRTCFQQKRKTLANNLRASGIGPERIAAALEQASVQPKARAEDLSLEAMTAIFHGLEA
jgi:16S rRNA (adenine1518-N6/adenine1519-N6)-dimethyltransferase